MSTSTSTTPPGPPDAPARRGSRAGRITPGNIVRSLGLLLVIVFVVVLFQQRGGNPVHVIDPSETYIGAQRLAHYQLQTPEGLGSDWRCTSARDERSGTHLTLHVGYVTPSEEYAEVLQSDLPRADVLDERIQPQARPQGAVSIDGVRWQRYPAKKQGEVAITRTAEGVTYIVTGSAGVGELRTLAASLRPYS